MIRVRGRAIAGIGLLALVALAAPLRAFSPGDWSGSPLLPILVAIGVAALVAPALVLAASFLLWKPMASVWGRQRIATIVLFALLLAPIPAAKHHFSDAAGTANPRGYFPDEPSWMLLGAAVILGGRLGPWGASFEFDETILRGVWAFVPLAWIAALAALLAWRPRPADRIVGQNPKA